MNAERFVTVSARHITTFAPNGASAPRGLCPLVRNPSSDSLLFTSNACGQKTKFCNLLQDETTGIKTRT